MTSPTDEELDVLTRTLCTYGIMDRSGDTPEIEDMRSAMLAGSNALTTLRTQLATLQLHLDSTNDKLEIERALTDGAHRRAREAEAEAHACGAEREAWKTRADRAEQRVATLEAALTAQPSPDVAALVDYVLQDDLHNRLTPRVVDIAYSAFMLGRCGKNKDDGGPCDWFNDTKPMVDAKIAEIRAALDRVKGGEA